MSNNALLVIDLQNDYFPQGKYPLWNTEQVKENIKQAIRRAHSAGVTVIHIQHIAAPTIGVAPFFNQGTSGADIHEEVLAVAPNADVVVKHYADSFVGTNLESLLTQHGIEELLICGMMTQNCVTHTAISKAAEKYKVSIIADCCTTVDEMIHNIALNAVSNRLPLLSYEQLFGY